MTSTSAAYAQAIAAELRAERARQMLTFNELVERTGISKSAVLNYLNGKRDIPLRALASICLVLGVQPSVIAERAENTLR
ncbi:transcriptional regulator with XRE-family HTH domain [Microbacterium sp. AK009]|uniref:helix-turn-helix domain-containing protein n=1 Tax=Microbacterium sp. AK009 TaxID=2723068 RepID=UPI0015C9A6B1|nr:helix-turn-helix transcriptional regulator [Microbacterium sp. AK009]NYF16029.1 transcriptional regulator with XRE-family HTH domain [Microbacterium sp. AK009]